MDGPLARNSVGCNDGSFVKQMTNDECKPWNKKIYLLPIHRKGRQIEHIKFLKEAKKC